ncbi:uncharacterized, partial [Tachysurus ichikawai]
METDVGTGCGDSAWKLDVGRLGVETGCGDWVWRLGVETETD